MLIIWKLQKSLVDKTEDKDRFKGWINPNSEMYKDVIIIFIGSGRLDDSLKKIFGHVIDPTA